MGLLKEAKELLEQIEKEKTASELILWKDKCKQWIEKYNIENISFFDARKDGIKRMTEEEFIDAIYKRKNRSQSYESIMNSLMTACVSVAKENGWIVKGEKTALEKARIEFEKFIKLREQDILKRQEVIQMKNFYEKAINEIMESKQ